MLTKIGDVEVWRVLESDGFLMPLSTFFPTLKPDALAAHRSAAGASIRPHPATGEDWVALPVQAFLVRTPRRLILIDACVGNNKTSPNVKDWNGMRSSRFLAALSAAGAAPEDVDLVLCTHLHIDHAGWTTKRVDGAWVPTFPNAKVLAAAEELDHARAAAEAAPRSSTGWMWRETIQPLLDAGCFEALPLAQIADADIDPAIRLTHTPGHTPGHLSVLVAGGAAAVTGDLIHSPIQAALPDLGPVVDAAPAQAAVTRRAFMDESARERRLTLATHFPLPSVGRFRAEGEAWAWVPHV